MNLQELKLKTPEALLAYAEELEIDDASMMRTQDLLFAILKQLASSWSWSSRFERRQNGV